MSDPTAAPAPAPEKAGLIDDLIEFWTAPGTVFQRRAKGGWFGMFVLVTLVIGLVYFANRGALQGIFEGEYARQMAEVQRQNPNIPAEQLAAGRRIAEIAQTFGVLIGIPIALLLIGLGAWLVGKILGAEEFGFGLAMLVASWSYLPRVIEGLTVTVQGFLIDTDALTGRYQLSFGVGRFLDPDGMSAGLINLLGRIDLFTLWISALLGIGICVLGKLPRGKATVAAAMMWCWGAIPALWAVLMEALRGT